MLMIEILSALEVLIFNQLTVDRCGHRKYSVARTVLVMAVFSLAFWMAGYWLCGQSPFEGDGRLSLFGLVYLIPLKYLYKEKPLLLLVIICTSWSYTLGVQTLSFQIADVAAGGSRPAALAAETALFLASVFPFYRLLISKYVFILENLKTFEGHWYKYMASTSFLYFLVLLALNNVFVPGEETVSRIVVLLLVMATICVSYFILYEIMLDVLKIGRLERQVMQDPLTGLGNRAGLWAYLQELLQKDEAFSVLFMDLDKFKKINDQYGHIVGDQYLKHFAKISSGILQDSGKVYRFGGDEFVAVYYGVVPQDVIAQLKECPGWESGAPCPFNSVSTGVLYCQPPHKGVEQILQQVDRLMYENKLKKGADTFPGGRRPGDIITRQ